MGDPEAPESTRAPGPSTRHESTRAALIAAGVTLLRDRPEEALRRLLSVQDVARLAGVHRQTVYRHWPDLDEYVGTVAAAAMEPQYMAENVIGPILEEIARRGISGAQDLVRTAARLDLEAILRDPTLPTQMLLWAILAQRELAPRRAELTTAEAAVRPSRAPYDNIAETLAKVYRTFSTTAEPMYEAVLTGWNRRLADGFSLHDFATVATAISEGLAMRTVADREAVRDELFADVLICLLLNLSEPLPPKLSDRVGPTPTVPSPGTVPSANEDARRVRGDRSRAAIIEAATFEFEMRGFDKTTVANIADACGLSEATVFSHFGSKNMLAVHVFARHVPPLRAEVERDLATGSPLEAVRRHMGRLTTLVRAYPGLADAMIEAIRNATKQGPPTDPNDPRLVAPLPGVLLPAVEAAQQAEELRADLPPFEVAAAITNFTVLHAFTRPTTSPADAAQFLFSLLVEGLTPRHDAAAH